MVTPEGAPAHAPDSATETTASPPIPAPDLTPPNVAFVLQAPAAERPIGATAPAALGDVTIPILVGDSDSGVKEVRLRWEGRLADALKPGNAADSRERVMRFDEPTPGARIVEFPWPVQTGYVLVEAVVTDKAGNTARDRRWLIPRATTQPRGVPSAAPALDEDPSQMTLLERRWELRVAPSLLSSKLLREWTRPARASVRLSRHMPKSMGSVLGHKLTIARFAHSTPTLSLRFIHGGMQLSTTLNDFSANVDISGWVDRRVTVKGSTTVSATVAGLVSQGMLSLNLVSATAALPRLEVDLPGVSSAVKKRVRRQITARANSQARAALRRHKPVIAKNLRAVHRFQWPLPGTLPIARQVVVDSANARPSGLTVRGYAQPVTKAVTPRRALFHPCLVDAPSPAAAPKSSNPPEKKADPPAPIVTTFHIEQLLTVLDEGYRAAFGAGHRTLTLPFGTVTVQLPLQPLALGCLDPTSDALWFQVAGIAVQGKVGVGPFSKVIDAEIGATLKLHLRTRNQRLQMKVSVAWLWTSLGMLGDLIASQLSPLERWRDVPGMELPTLTSKGTPSVALGASGLKIRQRTVELSLGLRRIRTLPAKEAP